MTSLRSLLRPLGAPLRWLLIGLGGQCRFYPSCSAYAEQAIRTRGAVIGSALAVWRVLRCNPFGRGGVEHVPGVEYEGVTHGHRDEAA